MGSAHRKLLAGIEEVFRWKCKCVMLRKFISIVEALWVDDCCVNVTVLVRLVQEHDAGLSMGNERLTHESSSPAPITQVGRRAHKRDTAQGCRRHAGPDHRCVCLLCLYPERVAVFENTACMLSQRPTRRSTRDFKGTANPTDAGKDVAGKDVAAKD